MTSHLEKFKERLLEVHRLQSALNVLFWDQQTYMPEGGAIARTHTVGVLAGVIHDKFTSSELERHLKSLQAHERALSPKDRSIIREVERDLSRQRKLPRAFVTELAEEVSKSHMLWAEARRKSRYALFAPQLKKLLVLKRREAKFVGYSGSPYNALLDVYEPGMTVDELSPIFYELREFLVPFLKKIRVSQVRPLKLRGSFSVEKQKLFNHAVMTGMGFDFKRGRVDESVHPFSQNFHPEDVRITVRYDEKDFLKSFSSAMHETGHALYEQGILPEHFGTPLGEALSLGVHESQSRMWENIVGKSLPFWKHFYPIARKRFGAPLNSTSLKDFYRIINRVKPSLIRVDADEVTYNLHIILRFEIEKELVEGSIGVEELPRIWDAKIKELLGIKVPSLAKGVLQDVHWSEGLFGYFPTYTLGNLYAAQFYSAAKKQIPRLEHKIAQGNLLPLREWLRENVHIHGRFYSAEELVKKVTGEKLTPRYFIDYITKKYTDIYRL